MLRTVKFVSVSMVGGTGHILGQFCPWELGIEQRQISPDSIAAPTVKAQILLP